MAMVWMRTQILVRKVFLDSKGWQKIKNCLHEYSGYHVEKVR